MSDFNLRKRKKPAVQTKQLEDEETTDDEEASQPARKRVKRKSDKSRESTAQPSTSNASGEEEENDEEDEEDEEEAPLPEQLVPNRPRRSTAGNKMAELMKSSMAADEFYDSAYGGFVEDDVDKNFMPDNSDDDEVDSDFDRQENEDEETASGAEEDENKSGRNRNKLLSKNKKWVVARFDKFVVNENKCDARTQEQRLKEAKKTCIENAESLKRFEEVEIERKKRQSKAIPKRALVGPRVKSFSSTKEDVPVKNWINVPELKVFEKPKQKEYMVCAVTGEPAKYIDPLTELPYASADAFKTIRACYKEFLRTMDAPDSAGDRMEGINESEVS